MEKNSFADRVARWFGSEHPVRCFIARFFGAIAVATLLIGFVVRVFAVLDKADIVKRALDTFSHYSSSLPWILLIVSFVLVLCIPGGPTVLISLLRRVKRIGSVELFPANDPDEEAIQNQLQLTTPPKVSEKRLKEIQKTVSKLPTEQRQRLKTKLDELRQRKKQILRLHAGRLGAVINRRDVRINGSNLFFDAYFRRGEDQILVCLVSATSKKIQYVAQAATEIVDTMNTSSLAPQHFSIHFVFYSTPDQEFRREDCDLVRKILFNIYNIRLFFYSVSEDFAVKPLEDIP